MYLQMTIPRFISNYRYREVYCMYLYFEIIYLMLYIIDIIDNTVKLVCMHKVWNYNL